MTFEESFWAKVIIKEPNECWLFNGYCNVEGYGIVTTQSHYIRHKEFAHRIAWRLTNGPTELRVLHKCDNPPCCNPAHLFEGTQLDNIADMVRKKRSRGRPRKNKL